MIICSGRIIDVVIAWFCAWNLEGFLWKLKLLIDWSDVYRMLDDFQSFLLERFHLFTLLLKKLLEFVVIFIALRHSFLLELFELVLFQLLTDLSCCGRVDDHSKQLLNREKILVPLLLLDRLEVRLKLFYQVFGSAMKEMCRFDVFGV
jgi:hypothetical protein